MHWTQPLWKLRNIAALLTAAALNLFDGRAASLEALSSTNGVLGPQAPNGIIGTQAPPMPPRSTPAQVDTGPTNGATPRSTKLVSTLKREVQVTDAGAAATWGRSKLYLPSDIASPISVITPDGRNLSCRPTFLVLENRLTGETLLLGAVTNSIGMAYSNSVVWDNVFDAGPAASVEIVYRENAIEQNLILRESPALPEGWAASDTVLECWTEWLGTQPDATESRTMTVLATDS
jgi:hypothetical protein